MTYDLFEHRHRFSAWAAARAAQRGLRNGTTEVCCHALKDEAKLTEFIKKDAEKPITSKRFDDLHHKWCDHVVRYFNENDVSAVIKGRKAKLYGRAAKLVGVYLKSMVVIGPLAETELARVAHPPIDSKLLKVLADEKEISVKAKKSFRDTRWQDLDRESYDNLIETIRIEIIRSKIKDIGDFWRLERYWNPCL